MGPKSKIGQIYYCRLLPERFAQSLNLLQSRGGWSCTRALGIIASPQKLTPMPPRSSWIPGSWHVRMVYTDDIPFHDPSQESNRAGQHQESHRRCAVLSDGS